MSKAEETARTAMAATVAAAILSAVAAIVLGVNRSQVWAVIFWGLAIAGCVVAWVAYRRYSNLRSMRWRQELSRGERELGDIFEQPGPRDAPADVPTATPGPTTSAPGADRTNPS